ncbi:hypothetical protein SDC9_96110 [bioreactor metagenome]|uniref:Uncharacterized protein n=1 Tax=bioreactor metagenome TaxID=1076179 RepID=A0A645AAR1_9ZZZZ
MIQHGLRTFRIGADQHAQVGQRVEEHVRLQLGLQQREARFRSLLFCTFGLQLQVARLADKVEHKRHDGTGDHGDEHRQQP